VATILSIGAICGGCEGGETICPEKSGSVLVLFVEIVERGHGRPS